MRGGSIGAVIWGNTGQCWGSIQGAVPWQYWGSTGAVLGAELGQYWGCALAVFWEYWGSAGGNAMPVLGCTLAVLGAVPWQ